MKAESEKQISGKQISEKQISEKKISENKTSTPKIFENERTEKASSLKKPVRLAALGVFVALAMIFSYIEVLIPFSFGIPGIKLGLANLVTVVGFSFFRKREVFLVLLVRILLVGMLFGNGASLIYSLTGGLLGFFVMLLVQKTRLSTVGVSIMGGVFHNIGQLAAAAVVLGNLNIAVYLPVLLVAGMVTGMLIGLAAQRIVRVLSGSFFLKYEI